MTTSAAGVLCNLMVGCTVAFVVADARMAVGTPVAVVVADIGLWISSHRLVVVNSRLVDMHYRSVVMYSGLWHVAVSIEVSSLVVVASLVGHEHRGMCVVEKTSVIVGVHIEYPAVGPPCHGSGCTH